MGDTKPIWLFYHLQNEKGESSAHPNACKVTTATPGRVTLQDVLDCFPLAGTSSFHFRFQVSIDKVPMFLDLTNPGDTVPTSNGNIIAKVLRLDTAPCATKNSYGLRLRSGAAEARAALAAGRAPAADAAPPPRSASIRVPGGAASAPATGGSGAVASPAGTVGGVPTLKPVKTVEVDLDVEAPEVVDDDLKDKSAYVQKMVMARREELKKRQEAALAEAAKRDDDAKKEQDDRDAAIAAYGSKLKDWAEEAGGTKKNVRILLSTLHTVLWDETRWEPVPMAKLIDPKRVRVFYLKACTIVHPDKQKGMDNVHKYVATQAFHYLESAYRVLEETELGA